MEESIILEIVSFEDYGTALYVEDELIQYATSDTCDDLSYIEAYQAGYMASTLRWNSCAVQQVGWSVSEYDFSPKNNPPGVEGPPEELDTIRECLQ